MARVSIEQFTGYTSYYHPVGYFQDGDFEAMPALLPDDPNILRPIGGSAPDPAGTAWCTVLIKATVSSDTHPDPEELSLWDPLNFVRTHMVGGVFSENPFSHIYFFTSGQSFQFNSITGNYNFVRPSLKAVGHRIPFRVLYRIATGSLEGGETSIGSEQTQLFSRDAGWEHEISSSTPGPGSYSYLTDVRLVPV